MSIVELADRVARLEDYATFAHETLMFIKEYYWEKAGVDWDKEEQKWKELQEK